MDEVIEFMNRFFASDYEARRAVYAEPDDDAFEEKVRAVEEFHDPSAEISGLGRAPGFATESNDALHLAARTQTLGRLRQRVLFLVRRYRHATFGDLYRCYTDQGVVARRSSYFESHFVARGNSNMRIVATWRVCLTCLGTGQIDDKVCYACGGSGWEPAGGKALGDLGPAIEVRRLQAPTDPVSLADYEKD